jgi:hypothetical protein
MREIGAIVAVCLPGVRLASEFASLRGCCSVAVAVVPRWLYDAMHDDVKLLTDELGKSQ